MKDNRGYQSIMPDPDTKFQPKKLDDDDRL